MIYRLSVKIRLGTAGVSRGQDITCDAFRHLLFFTIATMRWTIPALSLSVLLVPVQALYFYIDGTTPKCFFEELPKDTLVVGHYTAEEYNNERRVWEKHDGLNIFISVDVRTGYSAVPITNPPLSTSLARTHFNNHTGDIR